jgi:hypothetical protein
MAASGRRSAPGVWPCLQGMPRTLFNAQLARSNGTSDEPILHSATLFPEAEKLNANQSNQSPPDMDCRTADDVLAHISQAWAEAAGELAGQAWIGRYRAASGEVLVFVKNAIVLHELANYRAQELLAKLRSRLPELALWRLRFLIDPRGGQPCQ